MKRVIELLPSPARWDYAVHIVIEVDAPHLRDASFPKVPMGHRIMWRVPGSHRSCIAMFEEALAGQWDYLSEYVAAVSVTASRNGKCRRVRARVNRCTASMRAQRFEDRLAHCEHMAIRRSVTRHNPAPVSGEIAC